MVSSAFLKMHEYTDFSECCGCYACTYVYAEHNMIGTVLWQYDIV